MNEPNPYTPTQQAIESPREQADVAARPLLRWQVIPAFLSLLLAAGFCIAACIAFGDFCVTVQDWYQHTTRSAEVLTSLTVAVIAASFAVLQLLATRCWLRSQHLRATTYAVAGLAWYYAATLVRRDSLYDLVNKLTVFVGMDVAR